MDKTNNPLKKLIELKEIKPLHFGGNNYPSLWGHVFGGQILAQSLYAARQTVDPIRRLHSIHGYFREYGALDIPIIYQVEAIRNGSSYNTRRVVAYQNNTPIFNMSCSFHLQEEGFFHQKPMPEVPSYSELITDREWANQKGHYLSKFKKFMDNRFIEFRPVTAVGINDQSVDADLTRRIWLKCEEKLSDDLAIHKEVLAFACDHSLMVTTVIPHRKTVKPEEIYLTSLDHAMWFHRDFRADEWLLFSTESPIAYAGRGFSWGSFYNEKGELVASVAQEGIMRRYEANKNKYSPYII